MRGETSRQANIGPYRLLSRLGGGTGSVHRAAGPDGRDVAIRLLPPGSAPDVERMRKVLSPYAVDVLDGAAAGPRPYVVSRFVPGRPLAETVAEHGPLSGEALRLMASGLAKALAAVHDTGLAHGDLGPGSVLVVDGAPVVVDFGLTGASGTEASAADIAAWAATVAFAATGDADAPAEALPAALRPLVEAAADPDPAARPSAADLASAASALDLPAAPPAEPEPRHGDGDGTVPGAGPSAPGTDPAAGSAPDSAPGSAAGPGGSPVSTAPLAELPEVPGEAVGVPVAGARAHEQAVALGWARLLTAMVMVIAVCVVAMAPIVGLVLTLGAVTLLRAAGASARGWAWAVGRTLLSVPYAAVFAAAVPLGLVAVSAVGGRIDSLSACAFGAAAGAAVLWAAPGVTGPRRRLQGLFLPVARRPRAVAAAVVVLGALTLLAVVGVMTLTPSFSPMYGLQRWLEMSMDRLQHAVNRF